MSPLLSASHVSAEEGRGDANTRILWEVSNLNGMRKVMILTVFTVVTLLSSFSAAYAAYGLWYTTGSVQCKMPDGSDAMARVKVYLLKKQTLLLPFGYFELICSWKNTATQTVITTFKPTNWIIEWTFLNDDGYVACRASKSGSDFPAKVPTPNCDPYEATVTISAPIH